MAVKEKDFVEVEYTGKVREDNIIFDTTDEKTAKDNDIYSKDMPYGPVAVCVGTNTLLKGLEDSLIGKEPGSYTVELKPENAFGKKDAKLLKIVSTNIFRKANIDPAPGLQVNIDGALGTIKNVTGGRTIVDFNHPISGKDVVYDVKINRILTDRAEKVKAYVSLQFNLKPESFDVKIDEKDVAGIKFKQGIKLSHFNTGMMKEALMDLVGLSDVVFVETSPEKMKAAEQNVAAAKAKGSERNESEPTQK